MFIEIGIAMIVIVATLVVYWLAKRLYQLYTTPLLLPLLVATIVMAGLLLFFKIPYDTYMIGGQWIEHLLGPAVVALAYPLYKQWNMLRVYLIPIIVSITVGAVIGVVSGLQLAKWLGIEEMIIYSIIPKSVTTPVAMEVASTLGGPPPLAAIFVMVAGIGGAVLSPYVYKGCKLNHYLGKGIGMGSASHAIGTARALENGEKEGAASSIAMTLSAVMVSVIAPLVVLLLM